MWFCPVHRDSSKVDYSKYDYDMVFTSPPYYMLEKYENMPQYESNEDFNEKFLYPVIKNSYKYLKPNGHYILNIPISMYDDLKKSIIVLEMKIVDLEMKINHVKSTN